MAVATGKSRGFMLRVRLTEEEKERLDRLRGVESLSSYVRRMALQIDVDEKPVGGEPAAPVEVTMGTLAGERTTFTIHPEGVIDAVAEQEAQDTLGTTGWEGNEVEVVRGGVTFKTVGIDMPEVITLHTVDGEPREVRLSQAREVVQYPPDATMQGLEIVGGWVDEVQDLPLEAAPTVNLDLNVVTAPATMPASHRHKAVTFTNERYVQGNRVADGVCSCGENLGMRKR